MAVLVRHMVLTICKIPQFYKLVTSIFLSMGVCVNNLPMFKNFQAQSFIIKAGITFDKHSQHILREIGQFKEGLSRRSLLQAWSAGRRLEVTYKGSDEQFYSFKILRSVLLCLKCKSTTRTVYSLVTYFQVGKMIGSKLSHCLVSGYNKDDIH